MSELSLIDIEFESEGRLTCVGRVDTLGAMPQAVDDAGYLHYPDGFKVEVVKDGELWIDGCAHPLLPGVYHATACGLLHNGVPVHDADA